MSLQSPHSNPTSLLPIVSLLPFWHLFFLFISLFIILPLLTLLTYLIMFWFSQTDYKLHAIRDFYTQDILCVDVWLYLLYPSRQWWHLPEALSCFTLGIILIYYKMFQSDCKSLEKYGCHSWNYNSTCLRETVLLPPFSGELRRDFISTPTCFHYLDSEDFTLLHIILLAPSTMLCT